MPNPVLVRLQEQHAEQISTMDAILSEVGEDRDLVDAERGLLERARERIGEIDAQIEPLAAYEATRAAHQDRVAQLPRPTPRPVKSTDPRATFPTPRLAGSWSTT